MPVKQLKPADFSGRDLLKLAYVSVDDLALLDGNPKLHDKETIQASIIENGFRDPPTWDANLNNGQGGIVEGNGRSQVLKTMQDSGSDLPRGLAQTKEGKWVSPVIFGCDARSEAAAKRYAIDHNNITMKGGGFGAAEIGQMYNPELLMDLLKGLNDEDCLPLTVSEKDLNLLLSEVQDSSPNKRNLASEQQQKEADPFDSFPDVKDRPNNGTPLNTSCTIGEYRFAIDREQYLQWQEKMRQSVGFDENSVIAEIRRRLQV